MKRALVIRLGAYGDMIQTTCVFPYFTASGYELHVNCDERGLPILQHNPHVSGVIPHVHDSIPMGQLSDHWRELGKGYDRVAVLSGNVVESNLLWGWRDYMFWAGLKWRRKLADKKNYCEEYIKECLFVPQPPCRGELWFTWQEKEWAKHLVKKRLKKHYVMVWAYAGSSIHKGYARYDEVISTLLNKWPDLFVITVGGPECEWLDLYHERILNTSGLWSIRQSLAIVPYVNLVVGPETGVLNAAGCFRTPKVCLLSHSSKENLVKHWVNDYSVQAPCECSPCHRLHKYVEDFKTCPRRELDLVPCQLEPSVEWLVKHIERVREETYGKTKKNSPFLARTGRNQETPSLQPQGASEHSMW